MASLNKKPTPLRTSRYPSCPRHLIGEPRNIWREIGKEVKELGLITGADKSTLEHYCLLMAQLREKPNTFTADLHQQVNRLANQLCLTPKSRVNIKGVNSEL